MQILTNEAVYGFRERLVTDEKSDATIEKYVRDVDAFRAFLKGRELCKELVLQFKRFKIKNDAPATVNSKHASINRNFDFLGY